jgi:hypothetical protein
MWAGPFSRFVQRQHPKLAAIGADAYITRNPPRLPVLPRTQRSFRTFVIIEVIGAKAIKRDRLDEYEHQT